MTHCATLPHYAQPLPQNSPTTKLVLSFRQSEATRNLCRRYRDTSLRSVWQFRYLTYVRYDTLRHFAALCTTITAKLTDNNTLFIIPYLGVIDSLCLSCTTGHHFQRCYLRRSRQSSPITKRSFVISTERSDEKSMQALPRYFTVFSMTI